MQAEDQQLSANIFMHPSRHQTVLPSAHVHTHTRARTCTQTHTRTSYATSLASPDIQIKYPRMKIRHFAGGEMRLDEILTSTAAVISHAIPNGTRSSTPGGGDSGGSRGVKMNRASPLAQRFGCGEKRDVTRCCPRVAALHKAPSALAGENLMK